MDFYMPRNSVDEVLNQIAEGHMVLVVDDTDRENEGDLVMAAEKVTPESINFMTTYGRGLVCVPMTGERLDYLRLQPMVLENTSRLTTAFTVSVDAFAGTTTGISAQDRATTIKILIDEKTQFDDLARPGHIFPLRYAEGGVLVRAGHTEAALDLSRMAGLYPAAVLCEVMAEDGSMARGEQLSVLAKKHNLTIVSVADIIKYRRMKEKLIERTAEARIPTLHGEFTAVSYRSLVDKDEHVALVMGEVKEDESILVRVHSECLTGDVFGSTRCDCGDQMDLAIQQIGRERSGVFLYMRQEGRGIGIHNKLKAYRLQDDGMDTVDANVELGFEPDLRHYGVGAQILVDLGVGKMRFLTNNPKKVVGLESFGLEITERVPIVGKVNPENVRYLETKRTRMGHFLESVDSVSGDGD